MLCAAVCACSCAHRQQHETLGLLLGGVGGIPGSVVQSLQTSHATGGLRHACLVLAATVGAKLARCPAERQCWRDSGVRSALAPTGTGLAGSQLGDHSHGSTVDLISYIDPSASSEVQARHEASSCVIYCLEGKLLLSLLRHSSRTRLLAVLQYSVGIWPKVRSEVVSRRDHSWCYPRGCLVGVGAGSSSTFAILPTDLPTDLQKPVGSCALRNPDAFHAASSRPEISA